MVRIHRTGRRPGRRPASVMVAAILAGGCVFNGGDDTAGRVRLEVPDDPGLYARADGELLRLDGDAAWERKTWSQRAVLEGDVVFTLRDPAIGELHGPLADAIGIRKVAWVRSDISADGNVQPADGSRWRAVALPRFDVPVRFAADPDGDPEVVHVKPSEPLAPGLYALYLDGASGQRKSRFGVGWTEMDQRAYAATVCVDRHAARDAYAPCAAADDSAGDEPLRIVLADPKIDGVGNARALAVTGVVLNDSEAAHDVPQLAGELRGEDGNVLGRWRFQASTNRLEPGQSASFSSTLRDVPPGVRHVNVRFDNT